jgi:MFS family permease
MTARFLAVFSSEMQAVAVAWQVYALTHRPLDLGLVGLALFLPGILLFPVSGHTADRIPRLRILMATCGGFSLCSLLLLAYAASGFTSVYPIYLILVLMGIARAFHGPAGQAFLPLLVDEEHFPNAVTWSASIFQAATILGPMAGGVLYALGGSPIPVYGASVAAYLAALTLMARIRLRQERRPGAAPSAGMVWEGLKFIWRDKLILGAISLDLFAVLLGGAVALLPVYARDILKVGASGLGLLRSAPGLGALAMAIILVHRPLGRRAGAKMLWGVFGFGVFTIVFGLSRNMAVSLAALVLAGACDMVSVIMRQTLVQLETPDSMRGRVSAVNMVFIGASNEVGQFESGLTAQWFGTVPAVVLGGAGTLAVVLIWAKLFPALRQVDELSTRSR